MTDRTGVVNELGVKLDILIKNYQNLEKYKEAASILQKENEELKKRFDDIKLAGNISGSEKNIRETKLYISKLIREIDRCIALLSVQS